MSVLEVFDSHVKPEKIADVKALLAEALPDTRAFDGCQGIDVYFNTEDATNMVFVVLWDSKAHFEKYSAWRTETGFGEKFGPMLAGPPNVRFFERADL